MHPPPQATSAETSPPEDQHLKEMLENEAHWNAKPVLREVYAGFYNEISRWVDESVPGIVAELGSGLGKIREHLPQCVTTDIFPNPWLDQVEDAYRLSFADRSVSHLILFDVWHHLERTGDALKEFRRVLQPSGRLILFEPAMSWLGRVVYGLCHHEPLGLSHTVHWDCTPPSTEVESRYFAAQSLASRIFWFRESQQRLDEAGWKVEKVKVFPALDYLACGGFRGPCLSPPIPRRFFQMLNIAAGMLPRIFGTRLLVVMKPA